jgi:hypothetical protein
MFLFANSNIHLSFVYLCPNFLFFFLIRIPLTKLGLTLMPHFNLIAFVNSFQLWSSPPVLEVSNAICDF